MLSWLMNLGFAAGSSAVVDRVFCKTGIHNPSLAFASTHPDPLAKGALHTVLAAFSSTHPDPLGKTATHSPLVTKTVDLTDDDC